MCLPPHPHTHTHTHTHAHQRCRKDFLMGGGGGGGGGVGQFLIKFICSTGHIEWVWHRLKTWDGRGGTCPWCSTPSPVPVPMHTQCIQLPQISHPFTPTSTVSRALQHILTCTSHTAVWSVFLSPRYTCSHAHYTLLYGQSSSPHVTHAHMHTTHRYMVSLPLPTLHMLTCTLHTAIWSVFLSPRYTCSHAHYTPLYGQSSSPHVTHAHMHTTHRCMVSLPLPTLHILTCTLDTAVWSVFLSPCYPCPCVFFVVGDAGSSS